MTITEVKDYLGITDSTQDTRLTKILSYATSWVASVVGDVSDGNERDVTIQVKVTSIEGSILPLQNKGVTKLKTVNGVDVSGKVIDTDYMILENGTIEYPNLWSDCLTTINFSSIKVVYSVNLSDTDKNVYKKALAEICGYLLGLDASQNSISREKLGPREVEYQKSLPTSGEVPTQIMGAYQSLLTLIPSHLQIW